MAMLKRIPTGTAPVKMDQTPFLGGGGLGNGQDGRNCLVTLETPAAGVVLQGHDGNDLPANDSTEWFTVLTGVVGTAEYEIKLPTWLRRGAAAGADDITLHGVQ